MCQILVLDAKECSEGISLFCVRYLHMVDVPESWTSYVQRVGRAVRAFGHHLLSDNEQKVRVYLHVATLPQEMPAESKDLKLRAALDEVSSEFSDVNIFLSKEQVMEVVKNLRKRGVKTPTPAKLMQRAEYAKFPEHGMNFQELKDLISMTQKKSKGANGPWETAPITCTDGPNGPGSCPPSISNPSLYIFPNGA